MTMAQVVQSPASVDAYIRHGWSLVPIPLGTKGPRAKGWNTREAALRSQSDLPPSHGIGLAHAYSGTMALDIDDWSSASALLSEHGVSLADLYAAPDAVIIESGRAGRGKLLYAMPFGLALPSKRVHRGEIVSYELRCATSAGLTVQDVLPPSIHPETLRPYQWAGLGHWTRLPLIPDALLDMWRSMLDADLHRTIGVRDGAGTSWGDIQSALDHVSPDLSRDDWISIGMALHWAGHDVGDPDRAFRMWRDWSAQSEKKFPGDVVIAQQWRSFRPDRGNSVRLGTLFHRARSAGWVRPMPDVRALFGAVTVAAPAVLADVTRPVAPDLDVELWPALLATRAREVSESIGCDPLIPLWAGLSAVCAVVDARIRLELMPGFRVPPVLWLMTIGAPSDKKSPGSRPMLEPLARIEVEDRPRYQRDLLAWEGREAAYGAAKKAFLEFAISPEALLGGDAPAVPDLPSPPVPLRFTVSDVTSQKLVRQCAERPRGVLCYLDEMASWVAKMNDRSSGEDRSAWVVSYESQRYEMDRVGAGSIVAENLAVSVYGNIQPRVLSNVLPSLSADGLLQRFIPAVLRDDRTRLGNPIPDEFTSAAAWEQTLRLIYALPAQTYRLSSEAYDVFRAFQAWYEQRKRDERLLMAGDTYMTAFGKLEGTAGRLILLWHVIEAPFSPEVSAALVERVVWTVKTYLIQSLRYTLGEDVGADAFTTWVRDYLIQHYDVQTVTLSEIKRSARSQLEKIPIWEADRMVFDAMRTMEAHGWVARLDDGTRERQHVAEWSINPAIGSQYAEHRAEVIAAKQRVQDKIYVLSTKPIPQVYGR